MKRRRYFASLALSALGWSALMTSNATKRLSDRLSRAARWLALKSVAVART